MKKNYPLVLLLFVLNCFYAYAQPPVAVDDEFTAFAPMCGSMGFDVMSNDTLFGPQESYTIDLNPTQLGIQNFINSPSGSFFEVQGGLIYFYSQNMFFPFENIPYTIQDSQGNISNIAVLNLSIIATFPNVSSTDTSCEASDGQIRIDSMFSPANVTVYKEQEFIGTYEGLMIVIDGLAQGNYSVSISPACSQSVTQMNVAIKIKNPVTGSITPTYVDYNNDGIANVGDIINYQVNAANTSASCTVNDAGIFQITEPWVNGTYTGSGPIATFAPGATDNTSLNFYRPLKQSDINLGYVQMTNYIALSNPDYALSNQMNSFLTLNTTNGIKFNAFIDNNNNGIQDGSEQDYNQGTFSYTINSGPTHNVNTSTGEFYLYETDPSNVYTLNFNLNTNSNYCGSQYQIATSSYNNITVASDSGITTYNFAITTVPCQDVAVNLYSGANPRPGFVYTNFITYVNEGNQTASGTLNFTADSTVTLLSNSVSAPITGGSFSYNYTNLNPGESRTITVAMLVPVIPTVSLGQWLTNNVSITPTDGYAANNTATLINTIVGSYDPNDKAEAHGGKILHSGFTANDYLTYTIRFENTGTAEAINIRVNDVLDSQLDETSVKMVKASHAYTLDRVGNNLNWHFDGVNLPPSVEGDEITGHGYIVFKVKPKPGFALGDSIPNTANIYFDFNPAIVTNICTTQFVSTLADADFTFRDFRYYPNPVKNRLSISNASTIESAAVISVLGQEVLNKKVNDLQTEIDLSTLPQGVYFLKVKAASQEKTFKISKE